jgi:hypothetical protein
MTFSRQNHIRVSHDNWTLEESLTGKPFIPMGCNYYDPNAGGWPPKIWKKFNRRALKSHFQLMEDLGVNAIRVFVSWASFMPTKGRLSTEALDKCSEFLSIARRSGIRVNLTGPDLWEGYPRWLSPQEFTGYQHFIDQKYLDAHSSFWELFAAYYKNEDTIYGFDLVNEPFMPWSSKRLSQLWNGWLEEKFESPTHLKRRWGKFAPRSLRFGGVPIPPNVRQAGSNFLADYQRFREEMALRWVKNSVEAIRRVDKNHLITVGLHQSSFPLEEIIPSRYTAFNPHVLSSVLDYIALHWYPFGNPFTVSFSPYDLPTNLEKSLSTLLANVRYHKTGKPLIMEEFSYYGGGSPIFWGGILPYRTETEQDDFSRRYIETTLGSCAGWLNWPLLDTPLSTDTSAYGGFCRADGTLKEWGKTFRKLSSRLKGRRLKREPASTLIPLSHMTALTDAVACDRIYQRCQRIFRRGDVMDFSIESV